MRPMTLAAAALATTLSLGVANAASLDIPSGTYAMDPTHASLTWRIKHLGLSNYTARFTSFNATVNLNAEDVSQSSMTATIDPTSVTTDYPFAANKDFDAEIAGAKIMNAPEFPEISFTSTAIEVTGDNTATITGDLSMRGFTVPVTLDATLNGTLGKHPFVDGAAFGISATGTVSREAVGDTFLTGQVLEDTVEVIIEAEFVEQK
ncbi:MAG: YceI family protein [Pseudomonadota bacterium]